MKKVTILGICIIALVALANWAPNSYARSSFYSDNCAGCHGSTSGVATYPDNTCAGCHAHGVHPDSNRDSMNITATPDNTTYGPGDTILVQVGGGYRDGWVRVQMWDLNCSVTDTCIQSNVLVEESLYTSGSTVNFPGPVTLTATAPATPGDYTWYAGWYGNVFDENGAAFGLWIPDTTNSNHGNELVAFNFTVTGCTVNADCDDGVFCNGAETCDAGSCVNGTPPSCDDGVGCTVDTCDVTTDACMNTSDDAPCDDQDVCNGAETCDVTLDCQAGTTLDCDDGELCTTDSCDSVTGCANDAVQCPTGQLCDSADGQCKVEPECTVNADCSDGAFCNGEETCDGAGACQAGTPVDCSDGVACTEDFCEEVAGCVNIPSDANCDNGLFCDGAETCDPVSDCQAGTDPCGGEVCNETPDTCGAATCANYPDKGSCNADPNCQYFGKGKNGYCDDAPTPGDCSSLGRRKDCKADSNCSWVDNQCVDYVPPGCSDFTKKNTCTANGCSWDRVSGCSN